MLYAALLSAAIILAHFSRSRQIVATAYLLAAAWMLGLLTWWILGRRGYDWGYGLIDTTLAIIFWRMSKGYWFPVPLFFIHALQVAYYPYATLIGVTPWWLTAILNRVFEVELVYILSCTIYRLWRKRRSRSDIFDSESLRQPSAADRYGPPRPVMR